MKDEKKSKTGTNYRVGFCLLLAVVFLTVSLSTAARENPVFTGNSRLFNHYGNDNGLFSQDYLSGMNMSNQEAIEPIIDKPRVSATKWVGEIFLGMAGNVACGYAGGVLGYTMAQKNGGWFDGFGGAILGYFSGSTIGSALGVYVIGNSGDAKGSFGSALLGSLFGEGAAILLSLVAKDGNVVLISFITLPPIGAAMFFNSSLKYKSLPVSHALLNFNQGDFKIGIPYVHIQPLPGYAKNDKPTVKFNVNLLNIVF
jgi:hypothetical protein